MKSRDPKIDLRALLFTSFITYFGLNWTILFQFLFSIC
jgi:hypothetical protein